MQGANQTAAELGQRAGVINCGEIETGEIASSTVLPEPMSAVRQLSARGHGLFDKVNISCGVVQIPADAGTHWGL
jgi:hypothetical protein